MQPETKVCQNCKQNFTIEPEDFNFYEKIKVPPPTWCPECRMVRRIAFRNERTLYKRNCDLCNKSFIGMYPTGTLFPVYCRNCFISDEWTADNHAVEYDFNKPFFSQFLKIFEKVPRPNIIHYRTNTNADYSNIIADVKNVYLSSSILNSENIYYSYATDESRDVVDSCFSTKLELCYENTDCLRNNSCAFLFKSKECINSFFLFDCANCISCFMSSNLRNKKYVFRNGQMKPGEYKQALEAENISNCSSVLKLKEEHKNLVKSSIHKFANIIKSENVSGDNIMNCKNTHFAYGVYNDENCKYIARVFASKDCYDLYGCTTGELLYESIVPGFQSSCNNFCNFADNLHESFYSDLCKSSKNLFACIGLRNKQYCILNKQYTKEEYEELVPKIIKHMNDMPYVDKKGRIYKYGEFFPPELSPFAYNETIDQEYFPLTKKEALEKGYKWKDREARNYQIDIKTEDLPDNIKDVTDDIINKVIECEHRGACNEQCTEAFKIISDELQFYKRMNLPLPRLCPNCRHYQRLKQRNPLKLWHRVCMCDKENHHNHKGKCEVEFETSYAPDRPEIVYCEKCYQQEVY